MILELAMMLFALRSACWDASEPFECLDPPYRTGTTQTYRVYTNTSGNCCSNPAAWELKVEVPSSDLCAEFEEPDPPPGVTYFMYVAAWNSFGESNRAQPKCLNPLRDGIDPTSCPDGRVIGGPPPP